MTKIIQQAQALTLDIAGEANEQGMYGADISQNSADAGFGAWLSNLLGVVMVVGAVACLAFIVLGAIEWITSGGDKSKIEGARNKITGAIVGLIILSASLGIMSLVLNFLGIDAISFG